MANGRRNGNGRNGKKGLLTHVPVFLPTDTAAHARRVIEQHRDWQSVNYLYLLDRSKKLVGVLSIKELLTAPTDSVLGDVAVSDPIAVHEKTRPERAAILAIHHNVKMVPVVDKDRRFLGVIGTDAILETLQRAGIDDAIRYSGIHIEHRRLLDVIHGRVTLLARRRLPWLLVGLFGGLLASVLVGSFEDSLREVVELAFFMPAVIYMGDAVGTQTQSLFLRTITIGEVRASRFLFRELAIDGIIGAVVGALSWAFTAAVIGDAVVASIVGIAMFLTILCAGFVAVATTVFLARSKRDPALGAGPFATIIQDIVSISVYFGVASALLR